MRNSAICGGCRTLCIAVSTGHVDSNAPQTIANAKAAGIEFVDVYMFPCPRCNKNASTQVEEMGEHHFYTHNFVCNVVIIVNFLGNTIYGQIWLDIELVSPLYTLAQRVNYF